MKEVKTWQSKGGKVHTQYEAEQHELYLSFAGLYHSLTAGEITGPETLDEVCNGDKAEGDEAICYRCMSGVLVGAT